MDEVARGQVRPFLNPIVRNNPSGGSMTAGVRHFHPPEGELTVAIIPIDKRPGVKKVLADHAD